MEVIKDADQHTVCTADPYSGVVERICRKGKEGIRIFLPVGGEITFTMGRNCTIIHREGHALLRVNRYHLPPD